MKKIKNYFLYAFGEIVLVMLGILLAMQINNWNENRKTKNLAQEYFTGIKLDLSRDTSVFNHAIRYIEQAIKYNKQGLISTQLDTFPANSLVSMSNGFYFNLKINDATFINMRNGNLESIIEHREIYNKINHYYIFTQDYLDNFSEWEKENTKKESVFWEKQTSIEMSYVPIDRDTIPTFQDKKLRKKNIVNVLNSIEGRNLRKQGLMRLQGTLGRYKGVMIATNKLLETLEKETKIEKKVKPKNKGK